MGSVAPLRPVGPEPRGLGQVLRSARASPAWAPRVISRDTLEELHALMSLGPALVDASPTRVLFLTSDQAKARLAPNVPPETRDQMLAAPACALVGYDVDFAEQLVEFIPHAEGRPSCFDRPEAARQTAVRNGALQGAYLIVAARALGLEAADIRDFDAAGASAEFFRSQRIRATFLCSLGYAAAPSRPRRRRAPLAEAARPV
jgi:3-hydroxypropanoate dehydrogenase